MCTLISVVKCTCNFWLSLTNVLLVSLYSIVFNFVNNLYFTNLLAIFSRNQSN